MFNPLQFYEFGKKSLVPLLLDTFTGSSVSYSFRKLTDSYTGKCIEVKRFSDNVTLDIGFLNGVLDTSALLSFIGSSSGYISKWYNQSGSINNLVSGNPSDINTLYKIVENGVLITKNGLPACNNLHNKSARLITNLSISSVFDSVFSTFSQELSQTSDFFLIPFGEATGSDYYGFMANTLPNSTASFSGFGGSVPSLFKNNIATQVSNDINQTTPAFKTGNVVLSSAFIACNLTAQRSTNYPNSANSGFHHIQEIIMWGVDKTSDKIAIQNNIILNYNI